MPYARLFTENGIFNLTGTTNCLSLLILLVKYVTSKLNTIAIFLQERWQLTGLSSSNVDALMGGDYWRFHRLRSSD